MATQVTVITGEGSTTYSVSTGARGPAGPSSGATPAGQTGSVQINNAGALGADSGLVYTSTGNDGRLTVGGGQIYMSTNGTSGTALQNVSVGGGNPNLAFSSGNFTGDFNTSVGTGNFQTLTSGSKNVVIGTASLASITSGTQNFALGVNTLFLLENGQRNIAIGDGSGSNVVSGSDNIFIGASTGSAVGGGTHSTQITLAGTSDGPRSTVIGYDGRLNELPTQTTRFIGDTITFGSGVASVNNRTSLVQSASTSAKTITLPNATGKLPVYTDTPAAGQVLIATDASGAATWEDATSAAFSSITGQPTDNENLATALNNKESSDIQFYEDFSRYANGSTILNDGTSLPMIGPAWRINVFLANSGVTPIITDGGFGNTNSGLWYIGSVVPTEGDKFSFGCEAVGLPTGGGTVNPYGLNMSFSRREMLTTPTQSIIPSGVMHINTSLTAITDLNYFPDNFTSNGSTDVCTATNGAHGIITGDPLLLSGAGLPTGVTNGQTVYAIFLSTTTFKLATTYNNAIAGTAIDIGTTVLTNAFFQITDIVCLNRTNVGSGFTYQRAATQEFNKNGLTYTLLVEMDGEYLTVTRAGAGSIVFKIPSLARRTGSSMHFWYESSGIAFGTELAYCKITKAWAGAPQINQKMTTETNVDRSVIRGGITTTSSLELRSTLATTSLTSASEVVVVCGNSGRALTASHNGFVALGTSAPITTLATWPTIQIIAPTTNGGTVLLGNSVAQATNKDSSLNFAQYNGQTSGLINGIRVQSTSSSITTQYGGSSATAFTTERHSFYTGTFNTGTQYGGSERFRISNTGAITTETAGQTLGVKSGTNALSGTFIANGTTPVAVATTAWDANCVAVITLKTIGGTVTSQPFVSSVTAGTGFSVTSAAGDTSTYNWVALKVN